MQIIDAPVAKANKPDHAAEQPNKPHFSIRNVTLSLRVMFGSQSAKIERVLTQGNAAALSKSLTSVYSRYDAAVEKQDSRKNVHSAAQHALAAASRFDRSPGRSAGADKAQANAASDYADAKYECEEAARKLSKADARVQKYWNQWCDIDTRLSELSSVSTK